MAKRPRPVRPTLEREESANVDAEDTTSEVEESGGKSSKKFLFFFLFLMMISCAGGYGYLEYQKRYGSKSESEEVIGASNSDDQDELAESEPPDENTVAVGENNPVSENQETTEEVVINASNETVESTESLESDTFEIGDPDAASNENSSEEEPEFSLELNDEPASAPEELTDSNSDEAESEFTFNLDDQPKETQELTSSESPSEEPLFDDSSEEKTALQEDTRVEELTEPVDRPLSEVPESEEQQFTLDSNPESINLNEPLPESGSEADEEKEFFPPKKAEPTSEVKEEPRRLEPKSNTIPDRRPARRPPALNSESSSRTNPRSTSNRNNQRQQQRKINWKKLGGKTVQSPEGLIYGPGSREGHRIDHVLRHAKDQPDRYGKHGVFNVKNPDDLFLLLDEVYRVVQKRGPPDVQKVRDRNRTVYTVNMRRKIGYIGGQEGAKRNHPPAYKVRIVLEGKNVITAFPM